MKVALIHDYLKQDGGAEKVLSVMQDIWPEAPTFTLFFDPDRLPQFKGKDVRTSFLQRAPLIQSKFQWYLTLMPTATEHYDLSAFDVVVSSTSAFAKGAITKPGALHVCYCHTPTRFLWTDTRSYVDELRVPRLVKALLPPFLSLLRVWDKQAADRVDAFVANSETVRGRIAKFYGRDSVTIHPPVDVRRFSLSDAPKTYFLAGGRLVAYKRFDLAIEACNRTGFPLKIFGTGPVMDDLKRKARRNVEFLGRVPDDRLPKLYANAKAFIHPHEEDFGITAVESMAAGRPVIAYRRGGATETVIDGVTGELFDEQSWEELADHLIRFDDARYDPKAIRTHAERFGHERFKKELQDFVERVWIERGPTRRRADIW
jgi:glycosyltransferase involved in cell wall biosynthesis